MVDSLSPHEHHIETLSKAIDSLFVTRSQLAEFKKVDVSILNKTIERSVHAMVLCIDLKDGKVRM